MTLLTASKASLCPLAACSGEGPASSFLAQGGFWLPYQQFLSWQLGLSQLPHLGNFVESSLYYSVCVFAELYSLSCNNLNISRDPGCLTQ